MIRFGLCCMFFEEPIKFRTTTATYVAKMERKNGIQKINDLCINNAKSLFSAVKYCKEKNILNFRVSSSILPLKTHPTLGYMMDELPDGEKIIEMFRQVGEFVKQNNIRTCFHPDQFVVLNSPKPGVIKQSLIEIEYQAEVADWINGDVVNIHAGGAYGDKQKALDEFSKSVDFLSDRARSKLTVENDDTTYTPQDLLPVCEKLSIPLLYDVHHHRCNQDHLSIEDATEYAYLTWNREPMFHISSPFDGWNGPKPERHHDFIDYQDFPNCWKNLNITVEVEAKAKELAILQLMKNFC